MKLQSYTFSRQALLDLVLPVLVENAKSMLNDVTDGIIEAGVIFSPLEDIRKRYISGKDELANDYVEEWFYNLVSEKFFAENPDISDVLVIRPGFGFVQKVWLASR